MAAESAPAPRHATRAIEDIRVGQRVLGENPEMEEHSDGTAVDPASWRLVRLRAEGRWDDGTLDTVEVETLQPRSAIDQYGIGVGRSVPIPCDLEELALPHDMHGTVMAIEPCPAIEERPGHVVLLTVNHLNNTVVDLIVTDAAGQEETINPTAIHRFYSDTRRDWVAARDLKVGERLRGVDGQLTVAHLTRRPGIHRVYNVSVEGEHVYQVSAVGALVHNAYGASTGSSGLTPAQNEIMDAFQQLQQNRAAIQNLQNSQQQLLTGSGSTPLDVMGGYQNYLQQRLQSIADAMAEQEQQALVNSNYIDLLLPGN